MCSNYKTDLIQIRNVSPARSAFQKPKFFYMKGEVADLIYSLKHMDIISKVLTC